MQEVTLRIRFTQHCLGSHQPRDGERRGTFCMVRDPEGQVMFPPSWWRNIAAYGAQVLNRPVELTNRIDWAPAVDGLVGKWKRIFPPEPGRPEARRRYALHEAFLRGDLVAVSCVLPDGLSPADLGEIMSVAGKYKGISPYKPGQYGTFAVVEVEPKRRAMVAS